MTNVKMRGFSLIEVLIAFVILTIGVLGAASLIIRSAKTSVATWQYEQAHMLTSSFIELTRSHRLKMESFLRDESTSVPNAVSACSDKNTPAGCSESDQINTNISIFNQTLQDSGLPDPKWKVEKIKSNLDVSGNNLYEAAISWGPTSKRLNYVVAFTVSTK